LGALAARWVPRRPAWLPWGLAAVLLVLLALWDAIGRGGSPDFILIGLAGYELVMGLTEDEADATTRGFRPAATVGGTS
jgi:hypothetical protein